MLTDEILKRQEHILRNAFPQVDTTRSLTLSGSVQILPNRSCKQVTLLNITGENMTVTVNSGDNFILPTNAGMTVSVLNTNLITVNGTLSDVLYYLVSE